jgi:hypothetical protein
MKMADFVDACSPRFSVAVQGSCARGRCCARLKANAQEDTYSS